MSTAELSPKIVLKLQILQKKLGTDDIESALDKSLNIANFIADTFEDPTNKLLIERNGKYTQLREIKG